MGPKSRNPSKHQQNPAKKRNISNGGVSSQHASSLQLEDDVPDFPRGGGSSLSRGEFDEVRAEVDMEFEAEHRLLKKRKKESRVQNRNQSSEDDIGSLFGDGISGKLPRFANKITLKNVTVGMKLWGVIAEVNEKDIVVSLPGGLRGLVRAAEAFDPITKDLKGISIDLLVPGMMVNARVRSTLENGIMLSFLTYFTGTVDIFNLGNTFPTSNWNNVYAENKKVNARILFIDPSTRAVGLTLNPHLVGNKAPPSLVKLGDIFDQSKVIRVDKGSGLLLELPTLPISTPAYVNVTDVADKDLRKLEKSFKEGNLVRVRVLGFRHLEGLATGTLKASAFEGSVFTHSDVKPGMVVKAKVVAVDIFGAIVQFASGVKALCPLRHMSEFEIAKPRKKFQVGVECVFRVLGCKSKRITVTHKKTLVKSKLEILSSYADATEGLVTHGWITKIENHGCFVRFFNGVQGFVP
ncbi:rRNA biogenesis RRP5, partial [Olea europaea subsp. europaea]